MRDTLKCLLEVAGHVAVVGVFNEESFPVGRALAELVGAGRALNRQLPLADRAVAHAQGGMGQRKLGIELDRALKQRKLASAT